MIKDIKKYLKSLKYFKIILVFIIAIFSLSLGTIDKKASIITGVNSALSYNLIIFILLSVFISNILFLNRNLFNNYSYILRFKDKNTVLNNNIAISNFINFKFYLEAIIVIFIAVFIKVSNKTIEIIPSFYLLIYIVRYFSLMSLLTNVVNYLYLLKNKKIIVFYSLLLIAILITNCLTIIPDYFNIFYYLYNSNLFNSLFLDFIFTLGIISVYYSINLIVRKLCIKYGGE